VWRNSFFAPVGKDVHALHGGFEAWQEADGAVEPKRR